MVNLKRVMLQKAQKNGMLVSLHTDPSDMSRCSVGFVDALTETAVRLRLVSPSGEDDGYLIRPYSDIYKVGVGDAYTRKIGLLHEGRGQVFKPVVLESHPDIDSLIYPTLKEAMQRRLAVVIRAEDSDDAVTGFVEELTPEVVVILSLTELGEDDGIIALDLSTVEQVEVGSRDCQTIEYLFGLSRDKRSRTFDQQACEEVVATPRAWGGGLR